MWENRFFITNKSKALAKVLHSIDYTDPKLIAEAIKYTLDSEFDLCRTLSLWVKLSPTDALELLDSRFACPEIREYAVRCLKDMSESDLKSYLLQLVQALKYEPYHDSPLANFLITRALQYRSSIGQLFFWHLKAEMHVPEISERYVYFSS